MRLCCLVAGVEHVPRFLTDGQKTQKVYPEKLSEQAAYLAANTDSLSLKTSVPEGTTFQSSESHSHSFLRF